MKGLPRFSLVHSVFSVYDQMQVSQIEYLFEENLSMASCLDVMPYDPARLKEMKDPHILKKSWTVGKSKNQE